MSSICEKTAEAVLEQIARDRWVGFFSTIESIGLGKEGVRVPSSVQCCQQVFLVQVSERAAQRITMFLLLNKERDKDELFSTMAILLPHGMAAHPVNDGLQIATSTAPLYQHNRLRFHGLDHCLVSERSRSLRARKEKLVSVCVQSVFQEHQTTRHRHKR